MPLPPASGCRQSVLRPCELRLTHGMLWSGPPSQTPVHGDAGEPVQAGPLVEPERQMGHGCDGVPVSTAVELSDTWRVAAPVVRSIVPPAGAEKLFCTHVERPPFTIGSGVPKLQPVAVH